MKHGDLRGIDRLHGRAPHAVAEVALVVQRLLLQLREDQRQEPPAVRAGKTAHAGKRPERAVVIVQGQAQLLEVIMALHSPRGFPGGLHCRQ